jgi:demethylmenaquinone methyltransferase/2-methoxy-6-polyprenyl-1,4-benzoquinol methylase
VPENKRLHAAQEAARVLRPGGAFCILELGLPQEKPAQTIYKSLLRYGMPLVAGLFAPRGPYKYLAQSICEFPPPENIRRMLNKAGLVPFSPRPLSGGMCWLYVGKKPQST